MRIANIVRMSVILQKSIPIDASSEKPLPGISPLDPDQWLMIDDAYAAQMALRQDLITTKRDQVIGIDPAALPAARELLGQVVDFSPEQGVQHVDGVVQTPDGRHVPVDYDDPMGCMGQIAQNVLPSWSIRMMVCPDRGCVVFSGQLVVGGKFMRGLVGILTLLIPTTINRKTGPTLV